MKRCIVAGGPLHGELMTLHEGDRLVTEDQDGHNEYVKDPHRDILLWDGTASTRRYSARVIEAIGEVERELRALSLACKSDEKAGVYRYLAGWLRQSAAAANAGAAPAPHAGD